MYMFLDEITFQYRGASAPVLDRLSLFVRSGEIVAVVGTVGAGKTTLLRYVGRRSDGTGGVFLGSEADESGAKPGSGPRLAFHLGRRRIPAQVALGTLARGLDPAICVPEHGAGRLGPQAPRRLVRERRQRSLLDPPRTARCATSAGRARAPTTRTGRICCWSTICRRNGGSATRPTDVRSSGTCMPCNPNPRRRAVIYATRDPADAREVADRIAVLRRGRVEQCGTPSELTSAPASSYVAQLLR